MFIQSKQTLNYALVTIRMLSAQHEWLHTMSATLARGCKVAVVAQACILQLFQGSEQLSFSDIQAATGIQAAELKRNLQSLACVKVRWAEDKRSILACETLPTIAEGQHNIKKG